MAIVLAHSASLSGYLSLMHVLLHLQKRQGVSNPIARYEGRTTTRWYH